MKVSLRDWQKNGWVIEHRTSQKEIADLFGMADRDLTQCQTPHLSSDWQLSIAYNAASQVAIAALAAAGYRASREAHHYRVIQSLAHTIKADAKLATQLDKFRKKRNISAYEQAGAIFKQEAKEMFALAKKLRNEAEKWIRSNHPELLR
jgi:hypothetical protein